MERTIARLRKVARLGAFAWLLTAGVVASTARAAAATARPDPTPEQAKFFETKVRPLLAENCFSCHGERKQKGHLRLDTLEHALKGGDTGPALVPGDAAKSLLVVAATYKDADLQMPPDEALAPDQVKVLQDWVAMGAPWPKTSAAVSVPVHKKRTIKDADRQHWSIQPVKRAAPPAVADGGWSKNEIDRFVFAKLQSEGLTPAPEADKVTLIRRATFDLHGLPPTPEEVAAFVADKSPTAYETLIDRLLASPRYGERYARHWLDLARYAESDGFRQDAYRANAWMYRDWVIKSFNSDLPYDQFVRLQLAGDEIAPGSADARIATGFLRHGMYEYNQKDAQSQWAEYLTDVTDVTSDAILGLSMGCARCHDHKFDPILQSDYFRLQAFFSNLIPRNDLPAIDGEAFAKYDAAQKNWENKTRAIREEIAKIEEPHRRAIEVRMANRFPPPVQAMMAKPPAERSAYERQIAYLVYRQVDGDLQKIDDRIKGAEKDRLIELRKQLSQFDNEKPRPLPTALAATDVLPTPAPTTIPGDHDHRTFDPGYPVVMDHLGLAVPTITPSATSTGRRTALAQWLTDPAHPLTTRVIANRVWQWHFGRGIVGTSSDYGKLGETPSHPELLNWLTARFVADGWSLKKAHRLIMTSATYRQAGVRAMPEVARNKDPENRWLWRMNPRRLEAEQIRDAMLAVSGELQLGEEGGSSAEYTQPKRSIYTKLVRNTRDPLLDVFDLSEAFGSVPSRNNTTTATQSLMMINGDWPLKRAAAFAQRLAREVGTSDPNRVVDRAYELAYNRTPRADERAAVLAFLSRGAAMPATEEKPAGEKLVGDKPQDKATAARAEDPMGDVNEQPITQLMPQTGGQAVLMRNANPVDMLKMPRGDKPIVGDTFTVEAFVLLESLYESANVRVIASQWNGNQKVPGWSLGVTSEKSAYLPRNLILQIVGADAAGRRGGYEVIPSNLRLELHRVYYVGVAVNLADTSEKGVTFWVKDVGDMDAPLRSAQVKHGVTGSVVSNSPLIIGGREAAGAAPAHGWDGLIGEVRISNVAIKAEQNLWNEGDPKEAVVGHWRFEETPGFLKEVANRLPDLARQAAGKGKPAAGKTAAAAEKPVPSVKVSAQLIDLCHVLLNSSEFLYVD